MSTVNLNTYFVTQLVISESFESFTFFSLCFFAKAFSGSFRNAIVPH